MTKLTGKEIKALAEFIGLEIAAHTEPVEDDILTTEIVIVKHVNETGKNQMLAYFYDYPEEGSIDLDDF